MMIGTLACLSSCNKPKPDATFDIKQFEYDYRLINNLDESISIEYCFDSGAVVSRIIKQGESFMDKVRQGNSGSIIEGEEAYIQSDKFKIIFLNGRELDCYSYKHESEYRGVYDIDLYLKSQLEDSDERFYLELKLSIDESVYRLASFPE